MVWKRVLQPCPSLPRPEDSGWYYNEGVLKPKLMHRKSYPRRACSWRFADVLEKIVAASIGVASAFDFLLFAPRPATAATDV